MSDIAANNPNLLPEIPQSNTGYGELLRSIPAFRDLWIGQAISQLGDALYYLVFLFMVEKVTGDPKMVGIAGVGANVTLSVVLAVCGSCRRPMESQNDYARV